MTWPMHDAGSTTPETGPDPGPESLDPGHDDLGYDDLGYDDPGRLRRGRHAAPDPLPPLDGPMPGGGPSPAETTLPLALEWPAPPPRPLRTPRFTPHNATVPVDAPTGWRRVPRTTDRPREDVRPPQYPPPGYRRPPAQPPSPPPGPPPGAPRPAAPQRPTQRSSLIRSGVGMAVGTLASRGTG